MARVAIMLHTQRAVAVGKAEQIVSWLHDLGHECVLPDDEAKVVGVPECGVDVDAIGEGVDLAVSLGGDGNMLRVVRCVADQGVPVLGVNFGQLGYLTEIEPDDAIMAIERFFAGEHQVEERMRLDVQVEGLDAPILPGLNEVVVEKVDPGRTVRLEVELNGDFFTTYAADGLIVATPTGSTAYSLSARGPIVDPMHRALLLTPVASHSLFDRSLVLSPEDSVRIRVREDREALVAVDGNVAARLEVGQAVVCSAADTPACLVSFGGKDFHRTLKSKFGLADR